MSHDLQLLPLLTTCSSILAFWETPSFKESPQDIGDFLWWLAVSVPPGITFWPPVPEERNIVNSRVFYMPSVCRGGCKNVTLLRSSEWGAERVKVHCPGEAALCSIHSQNAGNFSPSTSVSILLSFLLISSWGRVIILSPLCPWIRSKAVLAEAGVIPADLSARDLRSFCMKQIFVKEEDCFLTVWRRGFPGGSVIKNPPADAAGTDSIPDLGRSQLPQSN